MADTTDLTPPLCERPRDTQEDTVGDTAPTTGGHMETSGPENGPGYHLTSNVPTRPRTGDTGDTSGDTGDTSGDSMPGGVRFAYRATVRRAQVHRAITEAFDLLGAELAHHPDEDDLPRTPADTTPPVAS